jgi:branched-chain amino acid transport system substrate-binding protein
LEEKMKVRYLFIFVVMLALLLAGCAPQATQAPSEPETAEEAPSEPVEEPASTEPLKVAILAPLSGAVPTFGISTRDGALLAIQEWNAKGGVLGRQIETIVEDSQCEADPSVNAANKVINEDGVKFIVGEVCSKASIPISEIANPAQVLQISPTSTNTAVTVDEDGNTKQFIFRACFIDPFQGLVMAKFARGQGINTAFIMYDQGNDYTRGLAEAFEESFTEGGGQVIGKETYTSTDTDFSAILTKVKDSGAEMLFLPDYYNIINLVGAQAKTMGVTAAMMGGDGWDSSDLDVAAADGGYYSNHYDAGDTRQIVIDWLARYGEAYKDDAGNPKVPDALATLAYDATNLLLAAIEKAGTDDPTAVAAAMESLSWDGVSGTITFDAQHNPIKSAAVIHVKDGVKTFVESVAP